MNQGSVLVKKRAKAVPLGALGKPSRGQRAWSRDERVWAQRITVLVQAMRAQRMIERLQHGGTCDEAPFRPMDTIWAMVDKTQAERFRWLRKLAQGHYQVDPKWARTLTELRKHAGLNARKARATWSNDDTEKRLWFEGLDARKDDPERPWRSRDAYDRIADRIAARIKAQCPALPLRTW